MKRRGFAIILVLATLVLLAMLAYIFIRTALIDRNIARNYMDNVRAKLISQSGVDYAVAKLHETDLFDSSWRYKGELNPSFVSGTITINGKTVGYSQTIGSTYGPGRDLFILKVKDTNSLINVNDGLDNDRVKGNLKRILNTMGKIVGVDNVKIGGELGDRILDDRPPTRYSSKRELLKAVKNEISEFNKFKNLVTTHAWQDPDVANPVPLSNDVLGKYTEFNDGYTNYNTTIGVYRYGRGNDILGVLLSGSLMFAPDYVTNLTGSYSTVRSEYNKYAIYALDELNPQWIELVSRSPVNINHADERVIKALLKDLKGIFVSERRSAFPTYFSCYSPIDDYIGHDYTYSTSTTDLNLGKAKLIDELGFLHSTQSIDYDPVLDKGLAKEIALHIKGCRDKKVVTTGPLIIDYTDTGSLWFRGPFKSWRQFNAFVDNLVQRGLLRDTRDLSEYYMSLDYTEITGDLNKLVLASPYTPVPKIASQAKADVLKANFNPNLHLNETNPDANIATLVDKTDLIVNSTEFCFTPMGSFEIESLGCILKESGSDNIIIANHKIDALVKLYDCYRETNQRQFLRGQLRGIYVNNTNNNDTLEIGPEPAVTLEQRNIAIKNEWGGYIALPTLKGSDDLSLSTLVAHYTTDFNAGYHADGPTYQANITTYNLADPTDLKGGIAEPAGKGPYVYSNRNRLARSFRKGDMIDPGYYAVSDLRNDGAYVERHASVVYNILAGGGTNVMKSPGFWSYWVKPWFHPESTGKARTFVSFTKYVGLAAFPKWDVWLFASWFFASHGATELAEDPTDPGASRYTTLSGSDYHYYKPSTLVFAHTVNATEDRIVTGGGRGLSSPALNHLYHQDNKTTYMKSGHWTHVICYWEMLVAGGTIKLLVNGNELSNISLPNHSGTVVISNFLSYSSRVRLGEITEDDPIRNWTTDATLDEFYIFSGTSNDLAQAKDMYLSGRYLRPSPGQSYFISQQLQLKSDKNKTASYSTITNPAGSIPPSQDLVDQNTKIIGLSWTWYAEDTDTLNVSDPTKFGKAILRDYKNYGAPAFKYPQVKVELTRKSDGFKTNELTDDGYTAINLELTEPDTIQYKVIIDIPDIALDTVLLYSPVFDDITIYYTDRIKFLSYSFFSESDISEDISESYSSDGSGVPPLLPSPPPPPAKKVPPAKCEVCNYCNADSCTCIPLCDGTCIPLTE